MTEFMTNIITTVIIPGAKSLGLAILVFIIGWFVIKWSVKRLKTIIKKSRMDNSLKPFIISLTDAALKVFLVVTVISILGVQTSSFVAVLASAGLAIGLAFQGSLSNFAGGVLLLTTKPFGVGDYIEVTGFSGTVQAIKILYTEIVTPDNKVIFIPNGNLSNSSIVNYSKKDKRRVDLKFGVSFDADYSKVVGALNEVIEKQPLVLKDPVPFVRMTEHGTNSIIYTIRVWVESKDYWDVYFNITEEVKKSFDEKNIAIPYSQMDVYIKDNHINKK